MKTGIQSTNERPYNVEGVILFDKAAESPEDLADLIGDMDDFSLSEAAIATVSAMRGAVYNQYREELVKPSPNEAKVCELKERLARIATEQDSVYSADPAEKRLIISKYAPKIRASLRAKADIQTKETVQPKMEFLPHG